ncbi:MAG: signal peptidase I, partial [Verrucomicrobiota bacterium]
PVVQLFDLARLGRVYVNVVAKEEEVIRSFAERTRLKFFTATFVLCESGNVYKIPAPKAEVERVRGGPFGLRVGQRFGKGDVIARGWVDTGDQVIVDKFSYHFFPPRRGEVFVFTTANIRGIGLQDPNMGSIHYIKRLAGVPKDKLEVRQPDLYVDGSPGTEFGFRRVMSQENGYRGYQGGVDFGVIPEDSYVALGDNSYNSLDSRSWGFVPENNLVGRALLVYWPFNRHFGVIR